jgi:hypothetical protein
MQLYVLADAYQRILDAMRDEEQTINLADTLESIEEAIDVKVEISRKSLGQWMLKQRR